MWILLGGLTQVLCFSDSMVTPEIFASHLCEDLRLPHNAFYKEIVSQIKRHLEEAQMAIGYDGYLAEDLSAARQDNREWFERQAKLRQQEVEVMDHDDPDEHEMGLDQFAPLTGMSPELRVTIKVSSVGTGPSPSSTRLTRVMAWLA